MSEPPFEHSPHEVYVHALHHYLRELPHAIDTKIEIFFAIVLGVLLFHVRLAAGVMEHGPAELELQRNTILDYAAILLLLSSMACALLVVWPRLSADTKGLSSFVAIAARPNGAGYAQEVMGLDGQSLLSALLVHCYELATITRRKMVWCRVGIGLGLVGIAFAVVSQFAR